MIACRNPDDRIILNTLQLSHYVEKVRWCMDRAGIAYEEEKDIGIFFAIVIGRMVPTLIIPKHELSISNSSEILKYLYADLLNKDEEKAKFMEPSVKNRELEIKIEEMGDNLRTYFYYHILVANKHFETLALKAWGLHEEEIPPWQKTILKMTWKVLHKFVIHVIGITKEKADTDLKKAEHFFEETDKLLAKNKFLLGTEEPTYLDISFASMASLIVWPDQYGGPNLSAESRFKITDFTLEVQKVIKKFRNTNSGKFVTRMYAEHR